MAKEINQMNWDTIIQKFSSSEGSIIDFCRENNISHHQLYYRRKKLQKQSKATFHAIEFNAKEEVKPTYITQAKENKDIRIEIGKSNIYLPANEIALLADIIKELVKSC